MAVLQNLVLGRQAVPRLAERRPEIAEQRPVTGRLVAVRAGEVLAADKRLRLLPLAEFPELAVAYLGSDDEGDYFCNLEPLDVAGQWEVLRNFGHLLTDRDAGLATAAVALFNWHQAHPCCSRCGFPTEVSAAGWSRRCARDATDHFPRNDPAVIVLVTDAADRLLLARQVVWPEQQFSVLAGFVEAGETLEAACVREVEEEVGALVTEVEYLGSQPWPFPSSLMLAFRARAVDAGLRPDGSEIAEAAWYSREELAAACAAGTVRLPPPASIARQMIDYWYGEITPADWTRR